MKTYDGSGESFESGFTEDWPCSRHHTSEAKVQMSSFKPKPAIPKSPSPDNSYNLNDMKADRYASESAEQG